MRRLTCALPTLILRYVTSRAGDWMRPAHGRPAPPRLGALQIPTNSAHGRTVADPLAATAIQSKGANSARVRRANNSGTRTPGQVPKVDRRAKPPTPAHRPEDELSQDHPGGAIQDHDAVGVGLQDGDLLPLALLTDVDLLLRKLTEPVGPTSSLLGPVFGGCGRGGCRRSRPRSRHRVQPGGRRSANRSLGA